MIVRLVLCVCLLPFGVQAGEIRALLVGVGAYPEGSGITNLDGPVNDVAAMEGMLLSRFGAQAANIRTLTDEQATRKAILEAIDAHLGAAAPGDTALFYFSGHGSWQLDLNNDEDDGVDETIIPVDGRSGNGTGDIVDDELGAAIGRLTEAGIHAVVILDACNSGTGLRSSMTEKRAPPVDAAVVEPDSRSWAPLVTGTHPQPVFIAASTAQGWAYESGPTPESTYGNFTREFIEVLSGPVLSYREAMARVDSRLTRYGGRQETTSEGPRDGPVFGESFEAPHAILSGERSGSGYLIWAGGMMGFSEGTTFEGYATALLAAQAIPGEGVAAQIDHLSQDSAILQTASDGLPDRAYFVMRNRSFGDEVLRVWADSALIDIFARIAADKAHIVMVGREALADVRFIEDQGTVTILAPDGTVYEKPVFGEPINPKVLADYLDKLTQYLGFFRRRNDSPDLKIEVRVQMTNAAGVGRIASMVGSEVALSEGRNYSLCVLNRSPFDTLNIYAYALNGPSSPSNAWIWLADPQNDLPATRLSPQTGAILAGEFTPNAPGRMILRLLATTSPLAAPKLLQLELSGVRSTWDACEKTGTELGEALCDVMRPEVRYPSKWETLDIPVRIFNSDLPRGPTAPPCAH